MNRDTRYAEEVVYCLWYYDLHKGMSADVLPELCTTLASLLPKITEWSTIRDTEHWIMRAAHETHQYLTQSINCLSLSSWPATDEEVTVDGVHLLYAVNSLNSLREAVEVRTSVLHSESGLTITLPHRIATLTSLMQGFGGSLRPLSHRRKYQSKIQCHALVWTRENIQRSVSIGNGGYEISEWEHAACPELESRPLVFVKCIDNIRPCTPSRFLSIYRIPLLVKMPISSSAASNYVS